MDEKALWVLSVPLQAADGAVVDQSRAGSDGVGGEGPDPDGGRCGEGAGGEEGAEAVEREVGYSRGGKVGEAVFGRGVGGRLAVGRTGGLKSSGIASLVGGGGYLFLPDGGVRTCDGCVVVENGARLEVGGR